jgi:hypothetical protein
MIFVGHEEGMIARGREFFCGDRVDFFGRA